MPRLYRGIWRAASSASTSSLCRLLQSYPNALVIGQGLAGVARHRAMRSHIGCANSGRIAPPIRQDLVCDRDNDPTTPGVGCMRRRDFITVSTENLIRIDEVRESPNRASDHPTHTTD